jgi:hypothetical protein
MDTIPHVDTLVKEYLMFRGLTDTFHAFTAECAKVRNRVTD